MLLSINTIELRSDKPIAFEAKLIQILQTLQGYILSILQHIASFRKPERANVVDFAKYSIKDLRISGCFTIYLLTATLYLYIMRFECLLNNKSQW